MMEYLLNTHTLFWYAIDDKHISLTELSIIESNDKLWISYVSIWKMAIKFQRGRLQLQESLLVTKDAAFGAYIVDVLW